MGRVGCHLEFARLPGSNSSLLHEFRSFMLADGNSLGIQFQLDSGASIGFPATFKLGFYMNRQDTILFRSVRFRAALPSMEARL